MNLRKSAHFKNSILILSFLVILSSYLILSLHVMPVHTFWGGDMGIKVIQIINLVEKNWRDLSVDYPGKEIDTQYKFSPMKPPTSYLRDGKVYLNFSIGSILLPAVLFSQFGYRGLYVIPAMASFLLLIVSYLLARSFLSRSFSTLSIPILGLTTPLFFYSIVFWEHSLAALFVLLSLLFLIRPPLKSNPVSYTLSGFCLGLSIMVREELYLFIPATILAYIIVIGRNKTHIFKVLYIFIGVSVAIVPYWILHYYLYGSPLGPHIVTNIETQRAIELESQDSYIKDTYLAFVNLFGRKVFQIISNFYFFLFGLIGEEEKTHIIFRVTQSVALGIPYLSLLFFATIHGLRKKENLIVFNLLLILVASIIITWKSLFSGTSHSLFSISPFIVFSFLAIGSLIEFKRDNVPSLLIILCFIYIMLLVLMSPSWRGGGKQWGPRFLLYIYPLMIIVALKFFDVMRRQNFKTSTEKFLIFCAIILITIGFFHEILGVKQLYNHKKNMQEIILRLSDIDSQNIVTRVWWLPQEAATIFYKKRFFYIDSVDELKELVHNFRFNQIKEFYLITTKGDTHFQDISLKPVRSFDILYLSAHKFQI